MNLVRILARAAQARELYKQYALNDTTLPISSDQYVELIEQMTGFRIERCEMEVDLGARQMRGWLHRFDDQQVAKVYVASLKSDDNPNGLTYCQQRFVVLKEACHILIDAEDTYTRALQPLLARIVFKDGLILNQELEDVQSEFYAMIAAMELLFPWELRENCKAALQRGEITEYDVAFRFRVPERYVSWVLSNDVHPALCEAHEVLNEIWSTHAQAIPTGPAN